MREIKKIEIEGETIFLKKGIFKDYHVIYPIKDSEGNFNWFNFITGGSYWNLFKIALTVGIIVFLAYAYKHDISMCEELISCGAKCPPIKNISNLFLR